MKRPTGFTILSLLLGWLSIAGFVKVLIQFNTNNGFTITTILAFLYGITALISAVGLFKFRLWSYPAVISWSVIVLITMLFMQFDMGGIYRASIIGFIGFAMFMIVLLGLLLYYVHSKLNMIRSNISLQPNIKNDVG